VQSCILTARTQTCVSVDLSLMKQLYLQPRLMATRKSAYSRFESFPGNGEVFISTVLSKFSPLSITVEVSLTPDKSSQQPVS